MVGGTGNDKAFGGSGRDFVIGGRGSDTLYGESDDDILVGGSTAYDEDEEALQGILSEWSANGDDEETRQNIRTGGGETGGFFLDESTLFDDNAADTLFGGAGNDWFIVGPRDKIRDRRSHERVN